MLKNKITYETYNDIEIPLNLWGVISDAVADEYDLKDEDGNFDEYRALDFLPCMKPDFIWKFIYSFHTASRCQRRSRIPHFRRFKNTPPYNLGENTKGCKICKYPSKTQSNDIIKIKTTCMLVGYPNTKRSHSQGVFTPLSQVTF